MLVTDSPAGLMTAIVSALAPHFKQHGFRRDRRVFRRHCDDGIVHVVWISGSGANSHMMGDAVAWFYVEQSVYHPGLDAVDGRPPNPKPLNDGVDRRLTRRSTGGDMWIVNGASEIGPVCDLIRVRFDEAGEEWFSRLSTLEGLLQYLEQGPAPNLRALGVRSVMGTEAVWWERLAAWRAGSHDQVSERNLEHLDTWIERLDVRSRFNGPPADPTRPA